MHRPKKKSRSPLQRNPVSFQRRAALSLSLASLFTLSALALPQTSYFLSQDEYLTSTKNQGVLGNCWAFSTTTAFESSLLRQGIVLDPNSPLVNLSEWHLGSRNGNVTLLTPRWDASEKRWEYDGWGAFNEYALGYWTRGSGEWELNPQYNSLSGGGGPVLESAHPLNRYPLEEAKKFINLSNYVPPAAQDAAPFHLKQSITYNWDGDLASLGAFQESLKDGLRDYGALSVYMFVGSDFDISQTNEGYIYGGTSSGNHAVTLVGWDDSKELTINGTTYTGGWLLQNSWSTDWGTIDPITQEGGYFWIPFADTSSANIKEGTAVVTRSNLYTDSIREYSPFITQNQIFAPFAVDYDENDYYLYVTGSEAGTPTYAAQKLTAPSGPRESTLAAIGLWQPYAGMTVSFSIYDEWDANGPTGNLLAQKTATLNGSGVGGYNEIDLDTPITLSLGQSFYVVVDFGSTYDTPVTVDIRTPRELLGVIDFSGLSWVSSDGMAWDDLYSDMDTPGIMFMKGIMIFTHLGNDGIVSGAMQTRGTFSVANLHLLADSELYLNGPLTIQNGQITFNNNSSDLKGSYAYSPVDLHVNGTGLLNLASGLLVDGDAFLSSGTINIGGTFITAGNFHASSVIVLGDSTLNTQPAFLSAQNVTVQNGATFTIDTLGHLQLDNSGLAATPESNPGLLINGGWITGSGAVVANVINTGYLAPGFSPGKITITGDFIQGSSGTYVWDADGKKYDQLIVNGDAYLDGSLLIAGGLEFGRRYKEIVKANAIYGTFSSIDLPEQFRLRVTQKTDTYSFLAAPSSYTLVARNENQRNVAKALDRFIAATTGDRATITLALDRLSFREYNDAFNAIMPGFHETTESIGFSLNTSLGQLLSQRLDAVRAGSTGLSIQGYGSVATYSTGDGKSTQTAFYIPSLENRWGLWIQGNGIFGKSNSIADIPNYRFNSGGALIGADYRWNETVATGVFGGYQGAAANYDNDGKVRMNGSNFGLYGTYNTEFGFYGSAVAMSSFSRYETHRPINFPSVDRKARGDFSTWAGSLLLETGYDFQVEGWRYGPLLSLQYTHLKSDGFTEKNAKSLDLKLDKREADSLQSNIGARVAHTWAISDSVALMPELRVFWNHEYLQDSSTYHAAFRNGGRFNYSTTTPSRDSVTTGAGIFARFGERWSANAFYNANYGSGQTVTHSVAASAEFSF